MSVQGVRNRRSSAEVRQLALDAASELFAEKGFAGASLREIAARAGLAEVVMYRHFGTKADLFREAVFTPFLDFLSDFIEHWSAQDFQNLSNEELIEMYVTRLYDILHSRRSVIQALLAVQAHENQGSGEELEQGLQLEELFTRADEVLVVDLANREGGRKDIALMFRLVFGLVLAAAVLDDLLFPRASIRPDREHLLNAVIAQVTHMVLEDSR